jgi:hypothetical protein
MTNRFAPNPVERFQQLAGVTTTSASTNLAPSDLQPIIEGSAGDEQVAKLASQVAAHSRLTTAQAKPLVEAAVKDKTDPKAKAEAVSDAVTGATAAAADIELSEPVMLEPGWRAGAAGILMLALLACIVCVTALGNDTNTQEAALIGLTVIGVLTLIGMLVLVMGYKNVTIKGTGPSAGGSKS